MPTALTLDNFLPYRLSYTSNLVSDVVAHSYDALFGLKIPEWRMIAVVAEHDGVTQQQIKVTVSRAAIALAERGLLDRKPNPADKRSHMLVLTAAGQSLYAEVAPRAQALEKALFAEFDPEDMALFVATLRRIDAAALAMEETHGRPTKVDR